MNNPKLSLIFCCYNVAQYIEGVFEWLNKQPYSNIEVVFVEDYSPDETRQKLLGLERDSRIKIIQNKQNLGVCESRNVGLRHVCGEYIGFPDPDDEFDLNWLVKTAEVACKYSPDVILVGVREDYENNDLREYSKNVVSKFSGYIGSEDFSDAVIDLEETLLFGYMANKFYKREVLVKNNIVCKQMALKEDSEFNIDVFKVIDDFYIINEPFYFYKKRRGGGSLSSKYVPEYFDIHRDFLIKFRGLYMSKEISNIKIDKLLASRFSRYFLSAIERNINAKPGLSMGEQVEWIKSTLTDKRNADFIENTYLVTGELKIVSFFIKLNCGMALLFFGYCVYFLKSLLPVLFLKIK